MGVPGERLLLLGCHRVRFLGNGRRIADAQGADQQGFLPAQTEDLLPRALLWPSQPELLMLLGRDHRGQRLQRGDNLRPRILHRPPNRRYSPLLVRFSSLYL